MGTEPQTQKKLKEVQKLAKHKSIQQYKEMNLKAFIYIYQGGTLMLF